MTRSHELNLGLIAGILMACPSCLWADDDLPGITVLWQRLDGDLYQLASVPPGEANPRLSAVELHDDRQDKWKNASSVCELLDSMQVVFDPGYSGRVRFVFTADAGAGMKRWCSDAFTVLRGHLVAEGTTLLQVAGDADEASPAHPDEITLDLNRDGTGGIVKLPDEPLRLDRLEVRSAEGVNWQTVPGGSQLFAYDADTGALTTPDDLYKGFQHRLRPPQRLRLIFATTDGTRLYASQSFQYDALAAVVANNVNLFGGGASRTQTHALLSGANPPALNQFKNLVVTLATEYRFHPTSGPLVFRYDHYPDETAHRIAEILRETATALETMSVEDATKEMDRDFEGFYESGESPYSLRNPYKDDWQPYLKELREEVYRQVQLLDVDDENVLWRFVLIELADGFDELALKIEGGTALDAGTARPDTYGTSAGGSGERRRVSCWNLLFGL